MPSTNLKRVRQVAATLYRELFELGIRAAPERGVALAKSLTGRLLATSVTRSNRGVRHGDICGGSEAPCQQLYRPPTGNFAPAQKCVATDSSLKEPLHAASISASLLAPLAIGLTNDGKVLLDTSEGKPQFFGKSLAECGSRNSLRLVFHSHTHCRWLRPKHELEIALSLIGNDCTGFFHFFLDYFPKINAIWDDRTEAFRTDVKVILPAHRPKWLEEAILLAGISPGCVYDWYGETLRVNNLILPVHHRSDRTGLHGPDPIQYQWIAAHMRQRTTTLAEAPIQKRIYISRLDSRRRQLSNEAELMEELAELGFESVVLSELSLSEQIQLFAQADVVLGPHGAGFTNILYGYELDVIELLPIDFQVKSYSILSKQLGHQYQAVLCESTSSRRTRALCRDIRVDIPKLMPLVTSTVAAAQNGR